MTVLFLVPILAVGYYLLVRDKTNFYKLHRYDGQLVYLHALYLGGKITFCGAFFAVLLMWAHISWPVCDPLKTYYLSDLWKLFLTPVNAGEKLSSQYLMFVLTCVLSAIFAIIQAWWGNTQVENFAKEQGVESADPQDSYIYYLAAKTENLIEQYLYDSLVIKSAIMVTFENGKVYIGEVIKMSDPNESRGSGDEFVIAPALSGYRKDTQEVVISTNYMDQSVAVEIVLQKSKVFSVTPFCEESFNKLQFDEKNKTKNLPKKRR